MTSSVYKLLEWLSGDPRTESQIERDVSQELEGHIEQSSRDKVAANPHLSPSTARQQALQHFGDVEVIAAQCKHIILKERIMFQRVNAILMIVVLLVIVGVSIQVAMTQRHNAASLSTIVARLTEMEASERVAKRRSLAEHQSTQQSGGMIYINGAVLVPGVFTYTPGLSVARLVTAAGGLVDTPARIIVQRADEQTGTTIVFDKVLESSNQLQEQDCLLQANDSISVERVQS